MSYWKALAKAHDVAPTDRPDALVDAYNLLLEAADALGCTDGEEILAEIDALKEERNEAREEKNEAEARAETAEARLETTLQTGGGKVEIDALETQLRTVRRERDDALARLATVLPLIESYSDLLAMARKFTSAGDRAKVPVKHVRAVGKKKVRS